MRDVTLREMIDAMTRYPDDAVFRWFQASHVESDGTTVPDETLRLTVGQVRLELDDEDRGRPIQGQL